MRKNEANAKSPPRKRLAGESKTQGLPSAPAQIRVIEASTPKKPMAKRDTKSPLKREKSPSNSPLMRQNQNMLGLPPKNAQALLKKNTKQDISLLSPLLRRKKTQLDAKDKSPLRLLKVKQMEVIAEDEAASKALRRKGSSASSSMRSVSIEHSHRST